MTWSEGVSVTLPALKARITATSAAATAKTLSVPVTLSRAKGTNIMANAPLHPDWRPSLAAWTFGHDNHPDGRPLTYVGDPSNAPEGYPNRSPLGFPLVYPGVNWNGKESVQVAISRANDSSAPVPHSRPWGTGDPG